MSSEEQKYVFEETVNTKLREFAQKLDLKQPGPSPKITKSLINILKHISELGITCYPWEHLKVLVIVKHRESVKIFNDENPLDDILKETASRIERKIDRFAGVPFTIQRICELILEPKKQYNTAKSYLFALEKAVRVTITLPVQSPQEYEEIASRLLAIMKNPLLSTSQDECSPMDIDPPSTSSTTSTTITSSMTGQSHHDDD